jgi:hypothetical protein
MWPELVADYAVYNTENLHICTCTGWFFPHNNMQFSYFLTQITTRFITNKHEFAF